MEVCYVGGITKIRGIEQLVHAMGLVQSDVRLNLAGIFSEPDTERTVKSDFGWKKVNALGFLNREQVRGALGRSLAGIVTFLPLPNHVDAQPNKMFEYMSAGIPVIASDFPLWREIIEGNQCGLLVNPLEPVEIAKAIDYLANHSDEARRMGENGRRAVMERYNWPVEDKKLLAFYEQLSHRSPA
jgi:glycosyltransferase involved in cell wall biosynthesis